MKKFTFLVSLSFAASLLIGSASSLNAKDLDVDSEISVSSASSNIEVDELLAKADDLVGETVTVEGVCTHLCSHGATKLFLMGSDDSKVIRVQAGEFGSFDAECKNSMVTVSGVLKEQRVSEDDIKSMEAKANESKSSESSCCSSESSDKKESKASAKKEKKEESSSSCCSSSSSDSAESKFAKLRAQIKEREEKEGKAYLSYFFIEAKKYEIQ